MPSKRRAHGLKLVKAHPPPPSSYSRTGEPIAVSGIYRVYHKEHRVPDEVTLIKDEIFPRCEKCDEAVRFKLLRKAADISSDSDFGKFGFKLFCLPVMEEISTAEERSTDQPKKAA